MDEIILAKIVFYMREYQEIHGIKKQCLANCQYLYDIIRMNHPTLNVKVKSVLVTFIEGGTTFYMGGHLVIILDDNIVIEPSHEIFICKNTNYYDNIKCFMENCPHKSDPTTKQVINNFITFIKIADKMNSGILMVADKKFYDDQADYVEKHVHNLLEVIEFNRMILTKKSDNKKTNKIDFAENSLCTSSVKPKNQK